MVVRSCQAVSDVSTPMHQQNDILMSSSIRAKALHEELMELPLPDVPVCTWFHRDKEGLKQPEGRQLQPPQVVTIRSWP